MKAQKPGTDQSCELTVYANGFPCNEHILPLQSSNDPNTVECFIPVSEKDTLTIKGHFTGTFLHGAWDLLVDGSFLSDKRVEGKEATLKFTSKRKLDWVKVFDNPKPEGYSSIYPPGEVVEGDLNVKSLDEDDVNMMSFLGDKDGLGSLVVIISVNQKPEDNYDNKYESMMSGTWKDAVADMNMSQSGIVPTHSLEVKVTDSAVHKNRQSRHKRHFKQTRFGHKPWAKFVFYYRSQMAIQQAGCITRPDKFTDLEPEDQDEKQRDEQNENDGEDEQDRPSRAESLAEDTPPPSQQRKKRLLGQSLFRAKSPDTLFVGNGSPEPNATASEAFSASVSSKTSLQHASIVDQEGAADAITVAMPKERRGAQQNLAPPAKMASSSETGASVATSSAATSKDSESTKTGLRGMSDEELNAMGAGSEKSFGSAEADDSAAGSVATTSPAKTVENITQPATPVQQATVHVKEEPSDHSNSLSTSSMIERLQNKVHQKFSHPPKQRRDPKFFPQDVHALASDKGVITAQDLFKYFDDHDIGYEAGLAYVGRVATAKGNHYFLKDSEHFGAEAERPRSGSDTAAGVEDSKAAAVVDKDAVEVKAEPGHPKSTIVETHPTSEGVATTVASPRDSAITTPSSTKRATSASRESTPSKKSKFSDLQKQKAELKAKVEEKTKRRLVFKKQVEAEQKVREEEARKREEEVMKEIEELERMNAEEDEEMAELEKLRAMQQEDGMEDEDMDD